jgi:hypothetical protein
MSIDNPFLGTWLYRSLLNDPDPNKKFNDLEFGIGTLVIRDDAGVLGGTIGGDGWSLNLRGSFGFGSPMQVRFQGKGLVGMSEWIYDYIAWLVPAWPNSTNQLDRDAFVGSVVRTIPHPGDDGTVHPAGVVASFYAVRM